MRAITLKYLAAALLALALAGGARADSPTLALRGGPTAGGAALSAGGYTLVAAIGQPAAGSLTAGGYRLTSGLAPAAAPAQGGTRLYLPLTQR